MISIDWAKAIELASRAPSILNTQPWRFDAHGATIDVWADRTRGLESLDPTGRQLTLSCGAAVEHLRLAVLDQGYASTIAALPVSESPDLLARVEIAQAAVPSSLDTALIAAIPNRATVRDPFEERPIPDEVVEVLRRDTTMRGSWVQPVTRRNDVIALSVLLQHADAAEQTDPSYLRELQAWRRREPSNDGVPDASLAVGVEARHTQVLLRDFWSGMLHDPDQPAGTVVDEKPLLVIIGTPDDNAMDWLTAGQQLARLLLRATSLGIVASPLGQVIDDPRPRQQLRAALGLVGWPQMVLRMGYGRATPITGRRTVPDVLEVTNR